MSAVLIGDCVKTSLCNAPSYIAVNRWYDKNEKWVNLNNYVVENDITLHTTVTASQFVNPKLVVKAKNMNIMARTNGRIILNTKRNILSGYGSHYYLIDADDLDDGIIYIHLSPKKYTNGKIQRTVYLTTQNDFMYNRIIKNRPLLIILIVVIHSLLFILLSRKNKYI